MIFIDRSRVSLDHRCKRARFWGNEFRGRGLAPAGAAYPLIFGSAIHEALAHVNRGERGPEALELVKEEFFSRITPLVERERAWWAEEQWCLLSGLTLGYERLILPQLLEDHEIYSVEGECEVEIAPGVVLVSTPDFLLRRKSDQTLWYYEFKSTKMNSGRWVNSWSRSIQAMAGAVTLERSLGEELSGYTILGLYKGYEDRKEGRTRSPFTYWWKKKDGTSTPTYANGLEMLPLWEREGGIAQAVAEMDLPLLADQFPQTQPLFVNRRLVETWLRQLVRRETEIASAQGWKNLIITDQGKMMTDPYAAPPEYVLDAVFPHNFDACEPAVGMGCPFTSLCFSPRGEEDPFSQGFKWREPHHVGDPAIGLHEGEEGR